MAAKDVEPKKEEDQAEAAGPMLDMSQAAVRKMIQTAKTRGYITYDELNEVLPPEQVSSEQIEDVMAMLSEMGINVIEAEEAEEEEGEAKPAETSTSREVTTTTQSSETLDRTDDPVRMYLREMGSVELLSREGEIAIAKRIEAGRATMISGLCESPLTFHAITIWRDELLEEKIMLRDVIDLETTFGNQLEEEGEEAVVDDESETAEEGEETTAEAEKTGDGDDDEDKQANLSLSAMEAALKPQVHETLDRIAGDYVRLAELQDA
ncbi:MAG: RNA polymerase sigma factor region1.1 domain-containing protein, partial [Pseudomonadota bacterium]